MEGRGGLVTENLLWVPLLGGHGGGQFGTAVGGDCGEAIDSGSRCTTLSGETGKCIPPTLGFQLSSDVSERFTTARGAGTVRGRCKCRCTGGRGACTYRIISSGVIRPKFIVLEGEILLQHGERGIYEGRECVIHFVHLFCATSEADLVVHSICGRPSAGLNMQTTTVLLQLNSQS
jgi:hypothetical protein